jgi:opacity protein-like surface antigen
MLRRSTLAAAVMAVCTAAPAIAQTWDQPTFFSPRPHDDLGIYAIKPDLNDWGAVGIWRQSGGINLGVRGGIGGGGKGVDRTVLIGAELFGPLNIGAAPLALYWVTGIGASFDGLTLGRIPAGISAGITFGEGGSAVVTPYVHPRVAFEVYTFDAEDSETETDFDVDVDVGVDVELGDRFILRGGYKIGDVQGVFGAGVAIRLGRGAEVR